MALSFSHTDNIIARYNLTALADSTDTDKELVDYFYLVNNMSTDAAPAMSELCPKKFREEYFEKNKRNYNDLSLRHFNVSRYTARTLAEKK